MQMSGCNQIAQPMIDERVGIIDYLLSFAVIVSQLAISNHAAISHYCSLLLYVVWATVICVIVFREGTRFQFNVTAFMLILVWGLTFLQNKLFYFCGLYRTGGLGVARTLLMCVCFYVVGLNYRPTNTKMHLLFWSYILGVFLLMLLRRYSGISLDAVDKNAMGAVSGVGLFAVLFIWRNANLEVWQKYLLGAGGIFIAITLVAMHTRSPMAAFIASIGGSYALKHRLQKNVMLGLVIFVLAVFLVPFFLEQQGFRNYIQGVRNNEELSLNSISSMRTVYWSSAWEDIKSHPWIGQGGWAYVDNFPLFVLRQGGLLSAILLFSITYGKFFRILKRARRYWLAFPSRGSFDETIWTNSVFLVLYFIGISLFEGYVPLGPATSTFILWLILGMLDYHSSAIQRDRSNPKMKPA